MPPIRVGEAANLNTQNSGIANTKLSMPVTPQTVNNLTAQLSQNTKPNYQQPLLKNSLPQTQPIQNQQNQQQKPTQTPTNTQQLINTPNNQVSGVLGNNVERNAAIADIALEATSTGSVLKILMLPFTIVKKLAGFILSHKKLAAFAVTVPTITIIVGPNLLEAIKSANENSAIATIKAINQAQTNFLATKFRCGELKELEQSQLIDSSISSGKKSGYYFTIARLPDGCEVYAKPMEADGLTATGNHSFYYSSRDNTLRFSTDKNVMASATSPAYNVGDNGEQSKEKPKIAMAK